MTALGDATCRWHNRDMPTSSSVSLPATISSEPAWIALLLIIIIWAIASWILWYHWSSYGSAVERVGRIKKIYFIGSAILFLIAVGFVLSL
jgi:hypothetical protein